MKKMIFLLLSVAMSVLLLCSAVSAAPADQTVYVNSEVVTSGDGTSADAAVKTLPEAYEKLGGKDGTIVLCGKVTLSTDEIKSIGVAGGNVVYSGVGYPSAELILNITGGTHFHPGDSAVFRSVKITKTGTPNLNFHTKNGITIESTATLTNPEGTGTVGIFGGAQGSNLQGNVTLNIQNAQLNRIIGGGLYKIITGNVAVELGAGVQVTEASPVGAKSISGNASLTLNGGVINKLTLPGLKGGSAGDVEVTLNSGTVETLSSAASSCTNLTLNLNSVNILQSAGSIGTVTGTKTLNLSAFNGEAPSGLLALFDTINIDKDSTVTYEANDLGSQTITVADGGSLVLSGYTAKPDGLTVSGKVSYGGGGPQVVEALTVYLDGDAADGGDGTSPQTAVQTLGEAYEALLNMQLADGSNVKKDADTKATIVVAGKVVQPNDFNLDCQYAHLGKVTLTSVYDGVDYRAENSAYLGIDVSATRKIQFAGPTILEQMSLEHASTVPSTNLWIYYGTDFATGEGFQTTWNGETFTDNGKVFSLRAGYFNSDQYKNEPISLNVRSGVFRNITLGTSQHDVANVTVTLGHDARVTGYVELGGVGKNVGDCIVNVQEGAYLNAFYLYGYINDTTPISADSVTLNIRGTVFKILSQRSKKEGSASIKGNLTVNLYGNGKITGASANYTLSTASSVTLGQIVLNRMGYTGTTLAAVEQYNVVNLTGSATLPESFQAVPAGTGILQLDGYTGTLNMDLTQFEKLSVSGNSDVSCLTAYPQQLPVEVETGSVLRLSSLANTAEDNMPTQKTGEGQVLIADTAYSGVQPVLFADFDNGDASDASGNGNNGTVVGSPAFENGYDGSKALHLQNTFGKSAQQYVDFGALKGVDLSTDDFTVSFWYQTIGGGQGNWVYAYQTGTAGTGVDFTNALAGGVIFSNRDCAALGTSGFAVANMPHTAYIAAGLTGADGTILATDGISEPTDGRWHMVSFCFDRSDSYLIYVDDELVSSVDSSVVEGKVGENLLTLGADTLKQYGLGDAYIDDFSVYASALSHSDIIALYDVGALRQLCAEVNERLDNAGSEYAKKDIAALRTLLKTSQRYAKTATAEDYVTAERMYRQLRTAYEAFLLSPDAALSMLLLSDIHISAVGDASSSSAAITFADPAESGISLDGVVNSGDFADNSSAAASDAAFGAIAAAAAQNPAWQFITSLGNHETQYTSASQNYEVSVAEYWSNNQEFISADTAVRKYGEGVLDSTNNYSYGMTLKGYHFLVINTDNPGQTGVGSETTPELDPIRHGVFLEEDSLTWVDTMLNTYAEDGLPIFVICHYPFIDSVPLSYFNEIPILDNSIGKQDAQIRSLLAEHDNVIYFSGHLHHGMGVTDPVTVTSASGASFTEVTLPSFKQNSRGYTAIPASWYMFVYEDEIVLRAKDFSSGEWLTQYDAVIPLTSDTPTPIHPSHSNTTTSVVEEAEPARYTDIAGHWAESYILDVSEKNWMNGVSTSLFQPDATLTRGMVVTILGRIQGISENASTKNVFSDVAADAWYAPYVTWAAENGIVNGYADGTFGPNDPITREQMCAMLMRYLTWAGKQLPESKTVSFTDSDSISAWALEAVRWCAARGVVNGYSNGSFAPQGLCTRAEAAKIFAAITSE